MKIIQIILKSGKVFDLTKSVKSDVIIREVQTTKYIGATDGLNTKWLEEPTKVAIPYLRIFFEDYIWEVKDDEVAAIKYENTTEEENSDIVML